MKTCPNCGTQHSNKIQECPHCNTPLAKKRVNKFAIIIPIATVYLIAMTVAILFLTHAICISHEWMSATCSAPKTCKYCGATEGSALEHSWQEATCLKAKSCKICGATEGKPLEHVPGEWTVTKPASLISFGREDLVCSVCSTAYDGRTIEKKIPKVDGGSFNFTASELVSWIGAISSFTVDTETYAESSDGLTYPITSPNGESGILMLNCALGNVRAIIVYFDNTAHSISLATTIGNHINDAFSENEANLKLFANKSYSSAKMTATMYDVSGMNSAVLAPSVFLRTSNILK